MALVLADRVKETTTTTGTGDLTLGGAEPNFASFSSALSDGDTTYYAIIDDGNADYEVGLGTYASGTNTLARTTILSSSNSGSVVNLSSGSKVVFITYPADRSVSENASGIADVVNLNQSSYSLTGTAIAPENGGIQYKTLSENTTFTETLSDGDGVILRIAGGDTYAVTWPTMTWVTGSGDVAPTLTGSDVVVIWQEGSTVYGAYVGNYA